MEKTKIVLTIEAEDKESELAVLQGITEMISELRLMYFGTGNAILPLYKIRIISMKVE